MTDFDTPPASEDDDSPPIFRDWSTLYAIVLILHACLIFSFYLFTAYYN